MYNDYYLLKRIEDKEGELSFASAMDSFTYKGEVIEVPCKRFFPIGTVSTVTVNGNQMEMEDKTYPQIGDKVIFLKGSGEDLGEHKAVKFEDIIMKI